MVVVVAAAFQSLSRAIVLSAQDTLYGMAWHGNNHQVVQEKEKELDYNIQWSQKQTASPFEIDFQYVYSILYYSRLQMRRGVYLKSPNCREEVYGR